MADVFTPEKRSLIMSRIHGKDTAEEIKVRKYLFSQGFRYRKNVAKLPGKPDIALPKYKTIIFIHGCFWHQHEGCADGHIPQSRQEYWIPKLERNIRNDKKHIIDLEKMGWNVIVIWECEIKKRFQVTMDKVIQEIKAAITQPK